MAEQVFYFGYGANRDPRMVAAITGVPQVELKGTPATLGGYKLAVQRLDQVPDLVLQDAPVPISPRGVLHANWGDDFASYVIVPHPEGRVAGMVWELTPEQRERIRDWELVDFGWQQSCEAQVQDREGRRITVVTERLGANEDIDREVDGMHYETWLADPEKFEAIAEQARREYDERMAGPEGPTVHVDINNP